MSEPHVESAVVGYAGVDEILDGLAAGRWTSRDIVEQLLERVRVLDDASSAVQLRAMAAVAEDALEQATRLDQERAAGTVRGALHGVPIVIKDNIEALGLPGLAGASSLRGRPTRDAPLVTKLREAGMVVLGSTNLSQWANFRSPRSTSGWSTTGGLVANPWALDRSAGGSSSGSGAALAAGYAPLAIGTETDGSIVCPASLNGVVGLKPTVGVTSRECVVPICASQDSPGPMGRSVRDVAALYGVLTGEDVPTDEERPLRVAFATTWGANHPATDALTREVVEALRSRGHEVIEREVAVPTPDVHNDELNVMLAELLEDLGAYLANRPGDGVKSLADVVAFEAANAATELPFFGHELFLMALESGGRGAERYQNARANNLQWAIDECLAPGLDGVDAILAPAYGPAWKSDLVIGGHYGVVASCATTASAIAGWPIMSVPAGLVGGLPVGVALVGRANDEWGLLRVARAVEEVATWSPHARPTWRAPSRG
ncbi:MAG: amidase [Acidobacteriota bacterium]|nr:amidase [Acidobacteriota bacterium]